MLRTERPGDMLPVYELVSAAFGRPDEAELVNRLRECGAAVVTMVEEEEYEFMGHLMLSPITIEGQEGPWLGLAPVAVHPDWQGQGIGSDLVREGLDTALEMDWKAVVVLGIPPTTPVSAFGLPATSACTASTRCRRSVSWRWSCNPAGSTG
jgi:putative acetyltransferase